MKEDQNMSHIWEKNIKILSMAGFYSKKPKPKFTLFLVIIYSAFFLWNMVISFACLLHSTENIFDIVYNCEFVGAIVQVFIKMLLVVYNRTKMEEMFECTRQFWPITLTSGSVQEDLKKIERNAKFLQNYFIICVIIAATAVVGYGIWEWKLPIGVWTLGEKKTFFSVSLIQQAAFFPVMVILIGSYDTLFVALSAEITIQFKILCYLLEQLSVSKVEDGKQNDFLEKLSLYIKYHNFLLSFVKLLQNYFSPILLIEYLTITPLICAEMFGSFEIDNYEEGIKLSLKFFALVSQLAFYCFTAHFVCNEALAVADAMYNSDWYSQPSPSLTIPISLIIQRSQQRFSFRAGGLVEINIRTLLVILRTSWSACAVMRAIKNH